MKSGPPWSGGPTSASRPCSTPCSARSWRSSDKPQTTWSAVRGCCTGPRARSCWSTPGLHGRAPCSASGSTTWSGGPWPRSTWSSSWSTRPPGSAPATASWPPSWPRWIRPSCAWSTRRTPPPGPRWSPPSRRPPAWPTSPRSCRSRPARAPSSTCWSSWSCATSRGPPLYPEGHTSDEPEQHLVAELIREKALAMVRDELPHSVAVLVEEMGPIRARGPAGHPGVPVRERASQKPIVVGKGGSVLRDRHQGQGRAGGPVRHQVYLDLRVKVAKEAARPPPARPPRSRPDKERAGCG